MEQQKLSPKAIIDHFSSLFGVSDTNWAAQMKMAKMLLKEYSGTQINYALTYYKNKGVDIYSLGFLFGRMEEPISMLKAEMSVKRDGNSGQRNRERIRQLRSTKCGTEYPEHLFTETRDAG